MSEWHKLTASRAVEILNGDHENVSASEAERRFEQYRSNELVERGIKSPWKILLEQFNETMVVILIIAILISALLGEVKDAAIILVIVVLNALLGFRQEYQAERSMEALKKLSVPTVRVGRDGHVQEVTARVLVPGDILLLEHRQPVLAEHGLHNIDHVRNGLCNVHQLYPGLPALDWGVQQPHPVGGCGPDHLPANGSGLRTFLARRFPYNGFAFSRPSALPGFEQDVIVGGGAAKMDQAANRLRR